MQAERMAAFCLHLKVSPAEFKRLTVREYDAMVRQFEKIQKQKSKRR